MLMKAYGIAPDTNPEDNFADAGDTYYTGYLAAAKRLGISAGVGNPDHTIEQLYASISLTQPAYLVPRFRRSTLSAV
jgi:hypothetical protein